MTAGQRIAQKRKELGLSQEALGEQLGVSRQAIYKWESDATLPEIEKLVALSRIFSVSVGWLLGVEDAPSDNDGSNSEELTEAQMKMVQEITDRYLAAQPRPQKRRWPKVLWLIACAILVVVLVNLFDRLDKLGNEYNNLQYSIDNIQNSINYDINSITDRVEQILKSQNDLTADYSTELTAIDETATMATFSFRAVPKTYQEGMVAWIDVVNEGAHSSFGPYDPERETFSGEFTVALTDDTAIYVIFEHEGVRQTQLLDHYTYLYRSSFPSVYLDAWPLIFEIDDKTDRLSDAMYAAVTGWHHDGKADDLEDIGVTSYRVGLFADQELVAWYTPTTRTVTYLNNDGTTTQVEEECLELSPEGIVLDREKVYCIAAVVVDQYGREFVEHDAPVRYEAGAGWTSNGSYDGGPHFEGWIY